MENNVNGQAPVPQEGAPRFVDERRPWYGRTWVIVLLLVLFWPAGIALMWARSCKWELAAKLAVTIGIAVLIAWSVTR